MNAPHPHGTTAGSSAAWMRTLFEVMDDLALIHDSDGTILDANAAAGRVLACPPDEFLHLNLRDIAPEFTAWLTERNPLVTDAACGLAMPPLGRKRLESKLHGRDGRVVDVDISTYVVQVEGRPAFLTVARDITQRRATEKALSDTEALYHSLVESLPQFIMRKDLAGRLTFCNQRYCESLGFTFHELLGKTDFDLFPFELAAKYVHDDKNVIRSGKVFEAVEEHRLPDGTQIFVQVVKTPVHDAQGNIIGIQGIFWDVTDKQRAALALTDSERRYRQLTEATLDGIIVVDQEERVLLFNPAAERMFGYKAAEVLGRTTALLISEKERERGSGFKRLLEASDGSGGSPTGGGRTLEMRARRKDGTEFPVEVALSVLSAGGEFGPDGQERRQFLGALRDLTERNRIRSILVQNEKLASIGMLSAGVAHEINNPLAFVANNIVVLERDCQGLLDVVRVCQELAARHPNDFAPLRKLAETIDLPYIQDNLMRILERTREGVDRVTRIVHSLRGLARTDAPRRQETNLPDLITNSVEILGNRLKQRGITVVQQHDPEPRVFGVASQLSQVILNLLVNAVQAVESQRREGGRIAIRTQRFTSDMLLEIADNGCGIAPEIMPRLFDPFFTTKEAGEGTGLGLSITHNIVSAHGGRIDVDSKPGDGAVFRIFLPMRSRPRTTSEEV
jgi:PAS domain S-box-containing protein